MSSYTVTLSSNSSTLRTTLFPAIRLTDSKEWEVALLDFTTYNSIPNIKENVNNKLHYYKNKKANGELEDYEVISLQTGSYEIDDINNQLQKIVGSDNINLQPNNSLLKIELKSKYYIDFTKPHSIGALLGFPITTPPLAPNVWHTAQETVNINTVNLINITCNIVQGSYKDGANKHILHTFYPSVPPGFKIIEKPHNLVYLPLNTSHISDIVLNILDQDDTAVDFRGETISIRLHIKPVV